MQIIFSFSKVQLYSQQGITEVLSDDDETTLNENKVN